MSARRGGFSTGFTSVSRLFCISTITEPLSRMESFCDLSIIFVLISPFSLIVEFFLNRRFLQQMQYTSTQLRITKSSTTTTTISTICSISFERVADVIGCGSAFRSKNCSLSSMPPRLVALHTYVPRSDGRTPTMVSSDTSTSL
uniref:Uncharacterized protein n=1 Tax=Anopheles christyi TaxID=43041 RepID=A0A182KIQ4_9DIPT